MYAPEYLETWFLVYPCFKDCEEHLRNASDFKLRVRVSLITSTMGTIQFEKVYRQKLAVSYLS
jgi:hypothetical protein